MLNGENNHKHIHKQVAKAATTYIFTSREIALLKKFKKNIFDNSIFTDKLYLFLVDKINLVS